jgi:hypothetical protein
MYLVISRNSAGDITHVALCRLLVFLLLFLNYGQLEFGEGQNLQL